MALLNINLADSDFLSKNFDLGFIEHFLGWFKLTEVD